MRKSISFVGVLVCFLLIIILGLVLYVFELNNQIKMLNLNCAKEIVDDNIQTNVEIQNDIVLKEDDDKDLDANVSCEVVGRKEVYVNKSNGVVSISMFDYDGVFGIPDIKVYNFNSSEISSDLMLQIFGISKEDFQIQFRKQYLEFFEKDNKKYIDAAKEYKNISSDFDLDGEIKKFETIKTQIQNMNYEVSDYDFYINDDGNIEFIVTNLLWKGQRALVSWKELGSEDFAKIVIK